MNTTKIRDILAAMEDIERSQNYFTDTPNFIYDRGEEDRYHALYVEAYDLGHRFSY
jgi:hypothetical protein